MLDPKHIHAEDVAEFLRDRTRFLIPFLGLAIFTTDMAGILGIFDIGAINQSLPYVLSLVSLATAIYTIVSHFRSGYLASYSVAGLLIFLLASPMILSAMYSYACGYFPEDSIACFISILWIGEIESKYLPLIMFALLIFAAEMVVIGMIVELLEAILRIFMRRLFPYRVDPTRGYISSLYVATKYLRILEKGFPGVVSLVLSMVVRKHGSPNIEGAKGEMNILEDHVKYLLGIGLVDENREISPAEYVEAYRRVAEDAVNRFAEEGEDVDGEKAVHLIASWVHEMLIGKSLKNLVKFILFASFLNNSFYFLSATADTGLFTGVVGIVGLKSEKRDGRTVVEDKDPERGGVSCVPIQKGRTAIKSLKQLNEAMGPLASRLITLLLILYFLYISPMFISFLRDVIGYGGRYIPMGFIALTQSLSIIPVWITSLWGVMMYKLEYGPLDPGILPKPSYMLSLASIPLTLMVSAVPMVVLRDNLALGIGVSSVVTVALLSLLIGMSLELYNLGTEGVWDFYKYLERLPLIGRLERERRAISNTIAFLVWTLCLEASLIFPTIALIISL